MRSRPALVPLLIVTSLVFYDPAKIVAQKSDRAVQDSLDQALEKEMMEALSGTDTSFQMTGSTSRSGSSTNPRISVIGSFLSSGTSNNATAKTVDLGLSEAEISFQSYVDPYAKADFFVGFGRGVEDPFTGPDKGAAKSGDYEADLEEAYLTTLSMPFALQLKVGKFRGDFGKINQYHPHGLGYADLPRMYVNYLGEEGLADRGVGLSWLVPNPLGFYQELNVEITSGALDNPSFGGSSDNLLYLGHLKNFFDVSDHTTLELGLTGMQGANGDEGRKTKIGSGDLTLKWKPLRENRYRSLEWTTEALFSHRSDSAKTVKSVAFYTFLNYQIAKRWFLGGRYDYSQFPDNSKDSEKAYSGILGFYATEFQKLELQYQRGFPAGRKTFNRILARLVFVIGAHGAHQY